MVSREIWKKTYTHECFKNAQITLVLCTRAILHIFDKLTRACFSKIALETILLPILIIIIIIIIIIITLIIFIIITPSSSSFLSLPSLLSLSSSILAIKRESEYGILLACMSLSFALLRSAIACIRGTRKCEQSGLRNWLLENPAMFSLILELVIKSIGLFGLCISSLNRKNSFSINRIILHQQTVLVFINFYSVILEYFKTKILLLLL